MELLVDGEATFDSILEGFATQMEAMFEQDFDHSEPIDADSLEDRPIWWRLGVKLSRLASPVL
ncbi:phospholipase D-like domain-containing protein [Marinobacter sp. F4206]|uniref:hypothetical protein n=1 Tax=Marinobacter sp. F4206 TaxID=2861777 RepID=UPI001C5F6F4F|nr:hypothetical protein [Marinobacter sp. F4206]MBW4936023.1 hypothetical protein [Marinobacter sp. F4206]